MASGPITSWQIDGETIETVTDFIFLGSRITEDGDCSHEIKRHLLIERKAMTNLDSILKSRDITLPTKVHLVKAMAFPELNYTESWAPKNWCFWTVVLEKILESPLYCKEIQPVHPKGNQSWIFIERTDADAPILWPPDAKHWLIGKDSDAGKDWRQEEKGTTEDEMIGWLHRLYGHEYEQALGVGSGQGSLQSMGLQRVGHDWATELTEEGAPKSLEAQRWHPGRQGLTVVGAFAKLIYLESMGTVRFQGNRGQWQHVSIRCKIYIIIRINSKGGYQAEHPDLQGSVVMVDILCCF